jgi:hypothetical protein
LFVSKPLPSFFYLKKQLIVTNSQLYTYFPALACFGNIVHDSLNNSNIPALFHCYFFFFKFRVELEVHTGISRIKQFRCIRRTGPLLFHRIMTAFTLHIISSSACEEEIPLLKCGLKNHLLLQVPINFFYRD